ncbi:hypothetical protein [Devosia sp.]|uniref:hypothetical protein n=1 Tax=Devosia sp. TaxID=1871048 RepID=UPI003F717749
MPTAANRLDWVDAAKGLSIILVVMMHSAYGVGEDLNGTASSTTSSAGPPRSACRSSS